MCRLVASDDGKQPALIHSEPLQTLIESCETKCAFACCGYDACEFTAKIMEDNFFSSAKVIEKYPQREQLIQLLISQILELKHKFGSYGTIQRGYEHQDCSDIYWTGEGVQYLSEDLQECLESILEKRKSNTKLAHEYEWYSIGNNQLGPIYGPTLSRMIIYCNEEANIDSEEITGYGCYNFSYNNISNFIEYANKNKGPKKHIVKILKKELKDFFTQYQNRGFYWQYYDINVSSKEVSKIYSEIKSGLNRCYRNH